MKSLSAAVLTCLVCACWVAPWCGELSAQQNIVGNVGYPQGLASVSGAVVQLQQPDKFAHATQQKEEVILKGVAFSADFGHFDGDRFVARDWFKTLVGDVDEVIVGGMRVDLLQKSFTNGCLMTTNYGRIPIAFTSNGQTPNTDTIFRCALAFSDEQLAKLRRQLAQGSKGDVHQSEGSSAELIGIGSPIAEAPSHTTGLTDRVSGGSAVSGQ